MSVNKCLALTVLSFIMTVACFFQQPALAGEKDLEKYVQLIRQANSLINQGRYGEALSLTREALEIKERVLGAEHPDVARTIKKLGDFYYYLGDWVQAEHLYKRAIEIFEKSLGPDDPIVASSLDCLAGLYNDHDDNAQAEILLKRALAIREKTLGPTHKDVCQSLNNLAEVYHDMGEYAKAEDAYKQSLEIGKKSLGPDNQDLAVININLAALYLDMGEYNPAASLLKSSLNIIEKSPGGEHPLHVTALNRLAGIHLHRCNFDLAEPLYQQALEIKVKMLGPDHPDVARSLDRLATLYFFTGEYDRAESLFIRALKIFAKSLGPRHADFGFCLNNLAGLFSARGDYDQAENLFFISLSIAVMVEKPNSIWQAQNGLSKLMAGLNRPEAAVFFAKQAVDTIQVMRAGIVGPGKKRRNNLLADKSCVYVHLSDLLIDQGRLSEAREVVNLFEGKASLEHERNDPAGSKGKTITVPYTPLEEKWRKQLEKSGRKLADVEHQFQNLSRKKPPVRTSENEKQLDHLWQDRENMLESYRVILDELPRELGNGKRMQHAH